MSTQSAFIVLSSIALISIANPTKAQGMGEYSCLACGNWMPVGLNFGGLSRWENGGNHGSVLLGAELSVLHIGRDSQRFGWGGYVDTTYDTHAKLLRSSVGPEVIFMGSSLAVGVDLGPLIEWNDTSSRIGMRARFFIPILFVTPYVGSTGTFVGGNSVSIEGGLLVKYPILIREN